MVGFHGRDSTPPSPLSSDRPRPPWRVKYLVNPSNLSEADALKSSRIGFRAEGLVTLSCRLVRIGYVVFSFIILQTKELI